MSKNSIGQFIAALRKANGMTQQNVADRLNVSNKAVSRWERDECAPDLSLIPALAEMFGVTCDELLKGERITKPTITENKEPRVEKQVSLLINRTLSRFKTLIWISLTLAAVGLVFMFGISYGFFRPVIGFAVMLLFEVCALCIAILAVGRTRDSKKGNELFCEADGQLISEFNNTLGRLSFAAFFAIFAVALLSLPLILFSDDPVNSVITPYFYFTTFFGGIVIVLLLVYLTCQKPYFAWVTGTPLTQSPQEPWVKSKRTMTSVQLGVLCLAGAIFVLAPYLRKPVGVDLLFDITIVIGLLCFAASLVCFSVYMIKNKAHRGELALPGIRNFIMMLPLPILQHAHYTVWESISDSSIGGSAPGSVVYKLIDNWHIGYIWLTLAIILILYLTFSIIDALIKRRSK